MEKYSAIETHCIMNGKPPLGGVYPQCNVVRKRVTFYMLLDTNGSPFYIGCTTATLKVRLATHLREAKNLQKFLDSRAAKIRSLKYDIKIKEIETVYIVGENTKRIVFKSASREVYWMCFYKEKGFDIVNQVIAKRHRTLKAA